jgi:hypothetical protein
MVLHRYIKIGPINSLEHLVALKHILIAYIYICEFYRPVAQSETNEEHMDHFEAEIGRCGMDMFGCVFAHHHL